MQNLERLGSVHKLRMGRLAIKFEVPGQDHRPVKADLVLFRHRPEQFPRLRGGKDFCQNSARINSIFKKYPAAAAAVQGVKTFFKGGNRPKGLVLEAIAWRLSGTFVLTPRAADAAGYVAFDQRLREESYQFFKYLVGELRNWTNSRFGDDLKRDLDKLPSEERVKYKKCIDKMEKVTPEMLDFALLERSVWEEVSLSWNPRKGPIDEYWKNRFERRISKEVVEYAKSNPAPRSRQLQRQYTKGFGGSSPAQASGKRKNGKKKRR